MSEDEAELIQVSSSKENLTPQKGRRIFKSNPLLTHVPSDITDLEITEINNSNGTWKANTCMLSKGHKDHCEKSNTLMLAQTGSSTFEQMHAETEMKAFEHVMQEMKMV